MKAFLFGVAVGVGLGVLFAPGPGEETRRELNERLNSFGDKAKRLAANVAQQVRDDVRAKKKQIKEIVTKDPSAEGRTA